VILPAGSLPKVPHWLAVGRGRSLVRAEAMRAAKANRIQHPEYRRRFALLLARVPDLATLVARDKAGTQHAIWLVENRDEVERFLGDLPPAEAERLNHPTAIRRRFERDGRPPRAGAAAKLRAAQRRVAKLEKDLAAVKKERDALKAQLAAAAG
jgi:hypothetical protein